MSKHFKMYTMITHIIGDKIINVAYSIWGMEVAVVSVFRDSVQYQIWEPMMYF